MPAVRKQVLAGSNQRAKRATTSEVPDTAMPRKQWIKPYEFWHPRVFEIPFYCYLALQCLRYRVPVSGLARANSALYHGEIGIGSKLRTQRQFDQRYFLPTEVLPEYLGADEKCEQIRRFAGQHGYPVILKPDIGMVGKGILKLDEQAVSAERVAGLSGDYLLQQFTPFAYECGVFFVRQDGKPRITGMNCKHFPTVVGNGVDDLGTLAQSHYRYSEHWATFLQYHQLDRVPAKGEEIRLSFIGSHTMGCMFSDVSHLLTPEIEQQVFGIFADQPGVNFARLDVKASDEASFRAGDFVVIEINGVSSLPTHMFDPGHSLFRAYQIFFEHGKYLAQIAAEQRSAAMNLLPLGKILQRVRSSQGQLDGVHRRLKAG